MKMGRRIIMYILWIVLGTTLVVLGIINKVDSFWSGMGTSLMAISVLRLAQLYRLRTDDSYREAVETETTDERSRFIRTKAWAWAGYLFILIAAVLTLVFKLVGLDVLSVASGIAICLMVLLYWGAYLLLRKKY